MRKLSGGQSGLTVADSRQPAITPEELEQNTIEILAACTVGWSGVVVDGKEIPFNKDNAKMLYTRFRGYGNR